MCYIWQGIIVNTLWIYGMNNISSWVLLCILSSFQPFFLSFFFHPQKIIIKCEYTENKISWQTQWKPLDIVSIMFLFPLFGNMCIEKRRIVLQNNEILENLIKFSLKRRSTWEVFTLKKLLLKYRWNNCFFAIYFAEVENMTFYFKSLRGMNFCNCLKFSISLAVNNLNSLDENLVIFQYVIINH